MKLNFLARMFFSYSSSCDDGELGTYNCDPCPLVDREYGRVRGVALIKKTYLSSLLAAPTLEDTWQDGIDDGNILIMPFTSGSYDPGEQKALPGFGDTKESYGTREMTLNWADPNYKYNYNFYNSFQKANIYVPAFRTSTLVHIFDQVAQLTAADPIEDDIESTVVWKGVAKVVSENIPSKHDASNLADIFSCS